MRIVSSTVLWTNILFIFLLNINNVYAACLGSPHMDSGSQNINLPVSMSVPQDTPEGTVIWSSDWSRIGAISLKCDKNSLIDIRSSITFRPNNTSTLRSWSLGVRGVAMLIYYRDSVMNIPEHLLSANEERITSSRSDTIHLDPEYRIELVKSSGISAGSNQTDGGSIIMRINNYSLSIATLRPSVINVDTLGCDVLSDNIIVELGDHDEKEFRGLGSTTPYQKFTIPLQCNGKVNISYAVTGAPENSAYDGVIRLDNDPESAKGIGVQLADENSLPLKLGEFKLWKTIYSASQAHLYLKARYIQTSSVINPRNCKCYCNRIIHISLTEPKHSFTGLINIFNQMLIQEKHLVL